MPDSIETKRSHQGAVGHAQPEVVLGVLTGLDASGAPLVDWPENPDAGPRTALTTANFTPGDVGRTAALLFAGGDPAKPLIVGLIREPIDAVIQETESRSLEVERSDGPETEPAGDGHSRDAEDQGDPDRILLSADQEIVLQCGKASIVLTRAGKILLRGTYLLSRSSGANRIKGGSIQLN